jgi:hypothetical protein
MFEPSTLRRIAVRALAVFAGVAAVTSVAMPSAFADNTYFSTLDVSAPSVGSIDSVDSNFNQIHCGPDAPGPCTITDQQTELGARPTSGWYTYQLQASNGPAGYSWKWTSGCSGMTPTCTITNDQEFTSVGGEWVDTQFPQLTTLRVPSWGRQPVEVSAVASDNGPIKFFVWRICPVGSTDCISQFSDTGLTYLTGLADGQYEVSAYAVDTGLNGSNALSSTITIDSVVPTLTVTSPKARSTQDSFVATVHFTVSDPGLLDVRCNVDGNEQVDCADGWTTPFLENGEHTIVVQARDQAGNQTTITRRFTVVDPHVTLIGTLESVYGQRASISVQVPKNSTGHVEFDDAGSGLPLCVKTAPANGKSTCTFSGKHFRPGAHDVFVRFTGDATHKFAGATFSYLVDKAPSTMSAVAQDGRYGATYPLQVTGLPDQGTGTVEFRVGDTLLCTARVRASAAACSVGSRELEPGDYRVSATYLGDDTYLGVTRAFRLTVAKGFVTMTATNSDVVPAIVAGQSITLSARGLPGNATGTVVFTSNGLTLCTAKVQRGAATCQTGTDLPVGKYVTTASYSGDVHYLRAGARTTFSVT